jgi:hypothetical protein
MELVENLSSGKKFCNIFGAIFNVISFLVSFFNYMMALVYVYKGRFITYDIYMAYIGFIAIKPCILGLILISKLLLALRRK